MDDVGAVSVHESLEDLVDEMLDVELQKLHSRNQYIVEVPVHELLVAVNPGVCLHSDHLHIYERYNLRLVRIMPIVSTTTG